MTINFKIPKKLRKSDRQDSFESSEEKLHNKQRVYMFP